MLMTKRKEKENSCGTMAEFMMVNGKMGFNMVLANTLATKKKKEPEKEGGEMEN